MFALFIDKYSASLYTYTVTATHEKQTSCFYAHTICVSQLFGVNAINKMKYSLEFKFDQDGKIRSSQLGENKTIDLNLKMKLSSVVRTHRTHTFH